MSRFTVNLNPPETESESANLDSAPPTHTDEPKKRRIFVKILGVLGVFLILMLLIGGIGGFFLLAERQKNSAIFAGFAGRCRAGVMTKNRSRKIIDTVAVVNSFLPQITDKAVELYGRNLPPKTISKVTQVAAPLMPSIKDRARDELPRLIREKTQPVEKVPYWMIALGASRAVDIQENGDTAQVKSKMADRPLELVMKRDGDKWKVVSIKDEVLAKRIAETIGQEIIALAAKGGINKAGEKLGVENLQDVVKQLEGIFK